MTIQLTSPATPHDGAPSRFAHAGALVISPDPLRRSQLVALTQARGCRPVVECETAGAALGQAKVEAPSDVCVIDGVTRDMPILTFVRDIRSLGWQHVTLVTCRHDAVGVRAALAAGVRTYVVMPTLRNRPAATRMPGRGVELSGREVEVLTAVAEGLSNKQVGDRLGLSGLTVKSHLARIARKLGTGDRAEMVAIAMRSGVIT
jgi:DNA-binding NarL/FixJ family response regulator